MIIAGAHKIDMSSCLFILPLESSSNANHPSLAFGPFALAKRLPPTECRMSNIRGGVATGSDIAINTVYWPPILPSIIVDPDLWMSMAASHSQWHELRPHCCKWKRYFVMGTKFWKINSMPMAHHSSVLCNCWRASPNASDAATTSRSGSISNCEPIDWVWHSAILRKPSTHSWRARALMARNFKMSPEAQLMVNVRESSSLGQTTAPAKCSCQIERMVECYLDECPTSL